MQDNNEQLRGVPDDGAQGSHVRCGRSCSTAAAGGSAREQWDRAWRTSETVEATDEVRRHCELLVENGGDLARTAAEGVILVQAGLGPRGGGGAVMARRAGRKGSEAKAEVRAELDWRVRECERKCFASGRLDSFP
jgi:hypothetical protein